MPTGVFGLLLGFNVAVGVVAAVMAVLMVAGSVACVTCAPASAAAKGKVDPGEVVVDEVAGQSLTSLAICPMLPVGLSMKQAWLITILGFLLFRVFDIAKPWPIRKLESLPAGWGVLADDLLAGVYAAAVLSLCVLRIV